MIEPTLPDPEQVLSSTIERQRQLLMASRKATLDAFQVYARTATAVADGQDKLAVATSDVEWLSRLLRAQASFTREMLDAAEKFTNEVMEP
jgi:hypothetical protein